ncbi:hypothetical protein K469DRAFT_150432 [Zopfia rhizophila CBS 207.26]|uniref:Secreted protein n=1 Tax=Zopfia rhizophila CBS 207.26 TaxID=1314779 RepID=A0A6A6E392_9PEZI|nr:hypothetical protein K469DRAFT_150432 [Zopfia rhizophila CBS 207.26]
MLQQCLSALLFGVMVDAVSQLYICLAWLEGEHSAHVLPPGRSRNRNGSSLAAAWLDTTRSIFLSVLRRFDAEAFLGLTARLMLR